MGDTISNKIKTQPGIAQLIFQIMHSAVVFVPTPLQIAISHSWLNPGKVSQSIKMFGSDLALS